MVNLQDHTSRNSPYWPDKFGVYHKSIDFCGITMQMPLTGKMGFFHALGGMAVGAIFAIVAFQIALHYGGEDGLTGPAIESKNIAAACRLPMLASLGWILVYYNMIGVQVVLTMCSEAWGMSTLTPVARGARGYVALDDAQDEKNEFVPKPLFTPEFVNKDKLLSNAGRFSANSQEHAVVFMTTLWLYTVFVDASSAGVLGIMYVIQRAIYPFIYMIEGKFTFRFEYVTQVGYGLTGSMLLGIFVTGMGSNWVELVTNAPYLYPIFGFATGSFILFPALPLGIIYAFAHFKIHRCLHADTGYTIVSK